MSKKDDDVIWGAIAIAVIAAVAYIIGLIIKYRQFIGIGLAVIAIVVAIYFLIDKEKYRSFRPNIQKILLFSIIGVFVLGSGLVISVIPQKSGEVSVLREKETSKPIIVSPRLGDSLSSFKEAYGEPSGDDDTGVFNDGKLVIVFVDDYAYNITIYPTKNTNASSEPTESFEQAEAEARLYMPKDAKETKRYQTNDPTYLKTIVLYNSSSLASTALSKDHSKIVGDAPGDFIVIYKTKLDGQVFCSIIGLGSNP